MTGMQTLDRSQSPKKPFRWGFASAAALIVFLMCVGHAIGVMLASFGPPAAPGVELTLGDRLAGLQLKDWIFAAFLASSAVFLWLQRSAVKGFFRSMHVGVSLVALSCLAVLTGVLIPQIDGFEDPSERVTAANYEEQYKAFAWAEAYFLYHLIHPYGIGMPEGALPPQVQSGLDRFGAKYGTEERDNREKQMKAAFSGNSKTQEIGELLHRHEGFFRGFFDVATALHLNRTYKSYWFATLLTLLGVGVFFNTFKGRPETWLTARNAGHFVVHLGVMILLVGGGISKLQSDRGILHMDLREPPKDEYWAYNSRAKRTRMPFAIKLERFARKDWPTLEVGFLDASFTSRPPEYTLWPGREIQLDSAPDASGEMKPRIRLKVLSMAERAQVKQPRLWDAETRDDPKGYGPLAELALLLPAPPEHLQNGAPAQRRETALLLRPAGGAENLAYDPLGGFRLATAYGDDVAATRREMFPPIEDKLGTLEIRDNARGEVESTNVPFRLGEKLTTPTGYTIEVQEATANFQLDENGRTEIRDPRPLSQQNPRNPGVWVQITPPGGGTLERRLLLESVDWETHDQQKSFQYSPLVLKLAWERWRAPGPPRFVLHWGSESGALLLAEDGGETPVILDRPLALGSDAEVLVKQLLHNAQFEKTLEFLAPHVEGPHFDEDFYSADPSGIEVQVTTDPGTPTEHVETVRMASTERGLANLWQSPDERFYLRFYENDRAFPFEWRSVLSIYEKDAGGQLQKVDAGDESEREIRVNDYLYYRGYRFFQTNAEPELPTYSGIGVVYDPGIPVVLFGMYTIILGAVLAFFVRPIVEAYGKRARGGRR